MAHSRYRTDIDWDHCFLLRKSSDQAMGIDSMKKTRLISYIWLVFVPILIALLQHGPDMFWEGARSELGAGFTMLNMMVSRVTDDTGTALTIAFSQTVWICVFIILLGDEITKEIRECGTYVFSRYTNRNRWLKKQLGKFFLKSGIYVLSYDVTCFFIAVKINRTMEEAGQMGYVILSLVLLYLILVFLGLLCNILSVKTESAVSCTLVILLIFGCATIAALSFVPKVIQWINPIWIPIQLATGEGMYGYLIQKGLILISLLAFLLISMKEQIRYLDIFEIKDRG